MEHRDALLITYGDLRNAVGRILVSAVDVLEALLSRGYWLSPRKPGRWKPGDLVLFYQARVGFTASAKLSEVLAASKEDWPLSEILPSTAFSIKLVLDDLRVFTTPIDVKPMIEQLTFITNKSNWGSAFRPTPKPIPIVDATLVLERAPHGNRLETIAPRDVSAEVVDAH